MKSTGIAIVTLLIGLALAPVGALAHETATAATDLSIGMRGQGVIGLQEFLIEKDEGTSARALATAGATGYFGTLTRSALAEYQAAHAIAPAEGYYGAKTRAFIAANVKDVHEPTFSGEISAVNTGCFADGICSVTVGDREVILLTGMRAGEIPPLGSLKGAESIGDLEGMIGATAKVYAATTTEGDAEYTLYGSKDYYVEVTPRIPAKGEITVKGATTCLPPKDPSKPTIKMCALGLKGEDGNYYALHDTDPSYGNIDVASDARVEVEGEFSPKEDATWKSVGIIEVTDVTVLK